MQTITIKAKEQEIKQELHKALSNYENGRAKLCTFKEVKSITDKIINRA
ncbi:TPA: hypothetical protein SE504_000109 [Campylobacter jejuni]|nr:hypothetical protein [Campylobacter jejuni]HED7247482.1 hypothetical protein [Campylobacter jejuni]HEG6280027.1 hypothetical protein [Campylobacter jejuni]